MIQRIFVLKFLLATATFASVALLGYAAATAPTGVAQRLGLRGLKRQRALDKNEAWAYIEPTVRWLGSRISGFLSDDYRERLNIQIGLAGDFLGLLPEEFLGLSIVTLFSGLLSGILFGYITGIGGLLIIVCAAFGAIAPHLIITSSADERFKFVNRRLPAAIDLLALGMGAGLDFPAAVRQVVEKSGSPEDPLVEEFTLILQALQIGRTRRSALEDFAARVPSDAVCEFVAAIVQAEMRGNPVANVLQIQAEVSRQRRSVRAEEAASRAGVAMVLPLVLLFLAILTLIVAPMVMKLQQGGL